MKVAMKAVKAAEAKYNKTLAAVQKNMKTADAEDKKWEIAKQVWAGALLAGTEPQKVKAHTQMAAQAAKLGDAVMVLREKVSDWKEAQQELKIAQEAAQLRAAAQTAAPSRKGRWL